MKRNLLFVITLLFSVMSFAQDLKQFKGNTLDPTGWTSGVLTYTYYQKKLEFPDNPDKPYLADVNNIKHGKYSVIAENSDQDRGSFKLVYSGNMKHGLRDGVWAFTENYVDFPTQKQGTYFTETKTVKMSFKDGIPDGQWSYTKNRKTRIRQYSSAGWSWHPSYETEPTENISFTFKNGVIVGQYIEKRNNWDGPVNISGSTNTQGIRIGKWSNGDDYGNDGYLLVDDIDKELFNLKEQYKQLSTNEEKKEFCRINAIEINEIRYSLTEHFRYRYYNTVDRTTQYTEVNPDNFLDSVPVMKSYRVERLGRISLNDAYNEFNHLKDNKLSFFELYGKRLSDEQIEEAKQKFENDKQERIKQQKIRLMNAETDSIYKVAVDTINFYVQKNELWKTYLWNNFIKQYGTIKNSKDKNPFQPQNFDRHNENNLNDVQKNKYTKGLYEHTINFINQYSIEQMDSLSRMKKRNINTVAEIYIKPDIYNSSKEIIGYLYNKPLTNQYSFIEEYNKYIELQQLHDYLLSLVKAKTKPLEKELKSATTVEQKYEIFLRYMNM